MIIHPLSASIATLLMAPDADASTMNAGTVTVDVIPSAGTGPAITDVTIGDQPAVESSSAVKAVEAPKDRVTKGPTDFGMESPEDSAERAGISNRARGADGKFLPKEPKSSSPASKPAAPAKPAAKPSVVPSPAMEAKVKIGGEERTAAEWEAHFKDLAAKATPTNPEVKQPEAPNKTEAETQAEQSERENKFLENKFKEYMLNTEAGKDYDQMLAGGETGAMAFAKMLAKVEMRSRQFAADQISKMAEHYESQTRPLLDRDAVLQTHLQDAAFLGAHEDIKSHPQGLSTYQQIKTDMRNGHEAIQAKLAAGTATKAEQGWALLYEDKAPEDLQTDIAEHTRAALAKLPSPNAVAPQVKAPVVPAELAKPKMPVERPLSADRPGAAAAPRGQTAEQRLASEVNAQMGHRV